MSDELDIDDVIANGEELLAFEAALRRQAKWRRQRIATAVLAGFASHPQSGNWTLRECVNDALKQADALIAALDADEAPDA